MVSKERYVQILAYRQKFNPGHVSMVILIEEGNGHEPLHRKNFKNLLDGPEGIVRIASAYVTDTQLLSGLEGRDIRLLTYLTRKDIVVGATKLDSLKTLVKTGVKCRWLSSGPRLHAKVYLFGEQCAVITSANLTRKALGENLEVGVRLPSAATGRLIPWFDTLWRKAEELDLQTISNWLRETEGDRKAYSRQLKQTERRPLVSATPAPKLTSLFRTANRFFVCNTNRRWSPESEKSMRDRSYAAAWEPFKGPRQMEKVDRGDAILMYAKRVGIIGIGRAEGPCQILESSASGRLMPGATEWRVPTTWLAWRDDSDAYTSWKSQNSTFFEVTENKNGHLLDEVRKHFLGQ